MLHLIFNLGNRKDPWMDFYGKSVLDNTLQDK